DRALETTCHARRREHDARAVAVTAEDRLMQIALLDVGRQTGARPAALNVANDDRDLGHRRPTNRFGLERNPRASAARHSEIPAVRTSEGDRDRCQFVFGLDKNPAILWQLAPER